ncbi:HYD1 signature containing ADP-ribosyltransferase family protein [Nocardia sp. 2YAB30]|uniref:HYD1 signature containing ADP-ribosyltransferase family protein n=1 Tax=unclassified Nocardia TaxID=2637762 RepID=UPI003F961555
MSTPIARLLTRVARDIAVAFQRGGDAVAERIGRTAKYTSESAEALRAADSEFGSMGPLEPTFGPGRSVELPAAGTGQRPPRVMYHYTSAHGLESILRSGKLRSSWGPGDRRGQFLTTIAPGTIPDIELADRIGLSPHLSHYVALDVNRLRWKKPVQLDNGNYLIRHRRALRIRRLLVGSGENPVVPF